MTGTTDTTTVREQFIENALKMIGPIGRDMSGVSTLAQRVGYPSHSTPNSGAFVDVVAADTGLSARIPSCVHTVPAIAEFVRTGSLYRSPEPGDIAFLASPPTGSAPGQFGMPRAGIVVSRNRLTGDIAMAEATDTEVLVSTVPVSDFLGFGRPDFQLRSKGSKTATAACPAHSLEYLTTQPDGIALVQTALARVTPFADGYIWYGVWDEAMTAAYAAWQRRIGRVGTRVTGVPTQSDMQRLAFTTQVFQVAETET